MTEGREEQLLDLLDDLFKIGCRGAEDYIAARDVGLNIVKTGGSKSRGQALHFDQFITADIDTAQKGHIFVLSRHRRIPPLPAGGEGSGVGTTQSPVLSPRPPLRKREG